MTAPFQNCGRRLIIIESGESSLNSTLDATGVQLYANNCSACHGPLDSTTIINKSVVAIKNALLNQAQMKFIILTDDQIDHIVSALNYTNIIPDAKLDSVKYTTVVKNRYALSSDFVELFVNEDSPTADDTAIKGIVDSLIRTHPEAFGGNCQRNDDGCTPTICGLASDVNDCRGKLNISAKGELVPQMSAISKGYINRACEEILKYDRAVENVLKKSGLTLTSPINIDTISMLSLFVYSGKIVPGIAIDQSIAISNSAKGMGLGLTDQWRFLILPYCISTSIHLL